MLQLSDSVRHACEIFARASARPAKGSGYAHAPHPLEQCTRLLITTGEGRKLLWAVAMCTPRAAHKSAAFTAQRRYLIATRLLGSPDETVMVAASPAHAAACRKKRHEGLVAAGQAASNARPSGGWRWLLRLPLPDRRPTPASCRRFKVSCRSGCLKIALEAQPWPYLRPGALEPGALREPLAGSDRREAGGGPPGALIAGLFPERKQRLDTPHNVIGP